MIRPIRYLSLFIVITLCFSAPVRAQQTPEEILDAVIKIKATIPQDASTAQIVGTEREGNGVVIDAGGHILTIGYLILEAETIEVAAAQGETVKGHFVAYDYQTGFGIIRADPPLPVKPLQLGQSSQFNVGDPILIAGYGGSEAVLGSRVVSRKEFVGYWEYLLEDAIYTTPPYPNYGGAALIDRNGRLLGIGSIYTQLRVPEIGIIPCNMSVPIDLLKPILADFFRQSWALGPAGVKVPLSILQETRIRDISVQSADRYQFLKVSRRR